MNRWSARLLVASLALWSGVAGAAGAAADLDELASRVTPVVRDAERLEAQVRASGKDFLSEEDAFTRYQDLVFAYMLGEHRRAAEGFFGLVTTGALRSAGLHTDAEWYLAEALFQLDNLVTAEARYLAIIEVAGHPFREDAVRRLLELYSALGAVEKFDAFYDREVGSGKVATTPLIRYAVAKSRHQQGDVAAAIVEFERIRPGPVQYAMAQYWLGALKVDSGDLDGALVHFQAVVDQSIDSPRARDVVDLGWLALGRIAYERGDLLQAREAYNRVSIESDHTPDRFYELVWTDIRREEWEDAIKSIDIFLLLYPDHEYTAQLQLIRGQLHMQIASRTEGFRRDDSYSAALGAFEAVVAAYEPVRDKFERLSDAESDPGAYLEQIVYLEQGGRDALPDFALSMMRSDPELARAIEVFTQLGAQERDLKASERLVEELRAVLGGSSGIAGLERIAVDAASTRSAAIEAQLALLESEEDWLLDGGAPAGRTDRVTQLRSEREALAARARGVVGAADAARTAYEAHEGEVRALRTEVVSARTDVNEHAAEIERLRGALGSAAVGPDERRQLEAELSELQADMSGARDSLGRLESQLARLEADDVTPAVPVDADVVADIAELHARYVAARSGSGGADGDRFDGLFAELARSHGLLDAVDASLGSVVASETARVRERFQQEVEEVQVQRVELERTRRDAEAVSVSLTREGFDRLQAYFSESVLKADSGIIDVYWAQKLQTADEIRRVKSERTELLAELETRFTLIRQKIGE